jgi:hypothetical protein
MDKPRIISVGPSGDIRSIETDDVRTTRERLARLAWLLDSSIPIPGTGLSIGVDALIGLIPFLGDLVGVVISSYIVGEAARLRAPTSLLLRMALNIGVEGVIGSVPLIGDIFDAAWKANQRNVRLLDAWLERPIEAGRNNRRVIGLILFCLGFLVLFVVALIVMAIRGLANLIGS